MADTKIQAIRFARALALVAALMLAFSTSARAVEVGPVEAPHSSASVIACLTAMVAAGVTITLGVIAAPATGNSSLLASKLLAWKMLGACLAGAASQSAREALTQ